MIPILLLATFETPTSERKASAMAEVQQSFAARKTAQKRHAPPNQRVNIFKFDAKDGNIIGNGHTASLTASTLRRNQRKASENRNPSSLWALGGNDLNPQPSGYERGSLPGKINNNRHFRARSLAFVPVICGVLLVIYWLGASGGHIRATPTRQCRRIVGGVVTAVTMIGPH